LSPVQADAIWAAIDRHAERRDMVERRTRPMPRSLGELAQLLIRVVATTLLGFLASWHVMLTSGSLAVWCIAGLAPLTGPQLARRRTRHRVLVAAFPLGVLSTDVVGLTALARAYMCPVTTVR
jgi:hypothetical protein